MSRILPKNFIFITSLKSKSNYEKMNRRRRIKCMHVDKIRNFRFFLEEVFTFSPEIPPVISSGCGGACLMPGASSDLAVARQRDGSAGLRLSLVKINKDETEDKTSFYLKKLDLHISRFFAPLLTICAAQDYCSISSRHTLCL